jgi:septal ring factor EnvC (AmiA/AmiB activator)
MNSQNNDGLGKSLNAFAESIREEINKASSSVDTKLGQRLNSIDEEQKKAHARIENTDKQLEALRRDIGSIKNDVAVGNGQLKTFTIPNKEGIIRYRVGGVDHEARVDGKGNVSGKHISTKNIKPGQIEVILDAPIEKDSAVSFVAGNLTDVLKSITDSIENIQKDVSDIKSLQKTQDETFVNIQKSVKESDDSIKRKVDEQLLKYKSEFEKMTAQYSSVTAKIDRINKKLIGTGNIWREEGLLD